MYIKVWRRIVGDPRFGRTTWTDRKVRQTLNIPSLDCFIRKRRLKYFVRLASTDFHALVALPQQTGHKGEDLPWVKMIKQDLTIFKSATGGKLDELPDAVQDSTPYWNLAQNHPVQWETLVNEYFTTKEDAEGATCDVHSDEPHPTPDMCYKCDRCNAVWPNARSLAVHM